MKYFLLIFTTAFCGVNTEYQLAMDAKSAGQSFTSKAFQTQPQSKITYASKRTGDGGWSIYSMSPDGSNPEILVPFKSGQGEYNPSLSPDGTKVLFNTYRYGGWKLASYEIGSSTVQILSKPSDYFYNGVYSNDGKSIVYERVSRGGKTRVCIADKNGANEVLLTGNVSRVENRSPVWTSDNRSVIFYNPSQGTNDIYSVNIDSKEVTNITDNKSGNDFNPAVSPNGEKVAFFSDRNGYLDVYVMDIAGKNQQLLSKELQSENNQYNYYKDANQYWMLKVAWSPDGKSLVFTNANDDNMDLFTIKSDGTGLKQITKTKQSELTPSWGMIKK